MQVIGDYGRDGYAKLAGLIAPEVAAAFVAALREDVGEAPIPLRDRREFSNLLRGPAFEIYGFHYKPMLFFLWGLTPIVSRAVGRPLLPSYDYFRLYREGDICRVHHDRLSCEHSLSLTLDYSDGVPWDLQLETRRSEPSEAVADDFGGEAYASLTMEVGDAALYKGVHHRHGRIAPNPNGWSAHLFLHWVDPDGPYREHAFDGRGTPPKVDFRFA